MDLIVRNLIKTFKSTAEEVQAIRGISFTVPSGMFFTLLGPSGCGKTTTLRCIAGLELPDNGEIQLGDKVFFSQENRTALMPEERGIGMVFQSYAIWPHMSVFDNVAFPLRYGQRRLPRSDLRAKVRWTLNLVQMEGLESRMATQLSGGQQQRVALARSLVSEPDLMLLDEPLSNLDAKLREEMRVEIRRIQKSLGLTTIYVTHDQTEALSMSDQIALLRNGEIVQTGSPREIYERPNDIFTSTFIGVANRLPGTIIKLAAPGSLGNVRVNGRELSCIIGKECRAGGSVIVSARPEDVLVMPTNEANNDGWTGTVRHLTYLGDSLICEVESEGLLLRARLHPALRIEEGQPVVFELQSERCVALPSSEDPYDKRSAIIRCGG